MLSLIERTMLIWQAVSGNPTTIPPGKETFTHYSKYRKNRGREKGGRMRRRKSPLNRNSSTIFSLSPNKKAIHDSCCSCKAKMKTNRLPPEIKTSLSCSAAFCAPLPITKKGDSWEKKSQEDKTKFQTHNCCRKLVHEWMAITSNSTRVTCVANHGSLPKWSCHYIAYRYDRCVIETVELEELMKLTVLTASCILVANWWYQFCNSV